MLQHIAFQMNYYHTSQAEEAKGMESLPKCSTLVTNGPMPHVTRKNSGYSHIQKTQASM